MYERHGELLLGSHASLMDAVFFFFNDTATTEIYTLSLHDALPISTALTWPLTFLPRGISVPSGAARSSASLALKCLPCCSRLRSEEHTSELQSRPHLVCRLLLEKKTSENCSLRSQPTCCRSSSAR